MLCFPSPWTLLFEKESREMQGSGSLFTDPGRDCDTIFTAVWFKSKASEIDDQKKRCGAFKD